MENSETDSLTNTDVAAAGQPEIAAGFGVARVTVKAKKLGPFLGRHPWLYRPAIQQIDGDYQNGDVVDVYSPKPSFIARGIINDASRLTVRLYTWDVGQPLNESFWRSRLERAIEMRKELGLLQPDGGVRLVFGEADGLSGLIVDRYGEHLVVQVNSLAMTVRLEMFADLLRVLTQPRSIIVRSEGNVAKWEGVHPPQGVFWGEPPQGPVFIEEHGMRWGVDLITGQKTGFYLDQRENRRIAASYMRGRRVLDLFCYSGGFALAAARLGGASEVLGIDTSDKAVELARANAALNEISNAHFRQQDCFQALDELRAIGECFDAVILDPPKFTRSRQSVHSALQAYHRINRLAVDLLRPDGILVTCSCSGNVSRSDFLAMLSGVAQKTRRDLQILEQRGASADHPLSPTCPENEYLKCFICRVG